MPRLSNEFLDEVRAKGRMTPGEARKTRKTRIEQIVASLNQKQVHRLIAHLVKQAETPTPDERGDSDEDCEDYWSAHHAGEIAFAREVLSENTKWTGAPMWPTENNY